MFVVVGVVPGVAMLSVHVVDVVLVQDCRMAAVLGVDMHVGVVRQMHLMRRIVAIGQLVDVIGARLVGVAVVEVVDVVLMRHSGMAAPLIVDVRVALDGCMWRARSARSRGHVLHAETVAEAAAGGARSGPDRDWRTLGARQHDEHDGRVSPRA